MRRVLVTGAAGFIGVPTVRRLLHLGYHVLALDNFSVGSREGLTDLGAEADRLSIIEADLRDGAAVRRELAAAEPWGVIHLAAVHFIPYCMAHPAETLDVNVLGTQNLLDAIRGRSARHVVFASTADVYRPDAAPHSEEAELQPGNVYGASKLMGEWLSRFHSHASPQCAVTIARLFNTYGPGETNPHVLPDILDWMTKGDVLMLGDESAARDYVFVEDVAHALASLLSREDALDVVVNIGTGEARSVRELVERLSRLSGRSLEVRTDREKLRRVDRPRLAADIARLRELVPDLALTPIDEGLAATLRSETEALR